MSKSRIVISDPHGCVKTLKALIAKLPKGVPITFAGDYIDRGSNSREVVEFIKSGGYDCVVGNHEVMMMDELKFETDKNGTEIADVSYYHGIWLMNGGDKCLDSYEGNMAQLKEHLAWFKTLPYFLEYKDLKNAKGDHLLVTHTTAAEAWEEMNHESSQFKNAVTWDRYPSPPKIEGIYNCYGHTPQKGGATVKKHFACIDGGAYFNREPYGRMIALQFPEMTIYEQVNIE
jgi:serine/threonine protein phosphatase 1